MFKNLINIKFKISKIPLNFFFEFFEVLRIHNWKFKKHNVEGKKRKHEAESWSNDLTFIIAWGDNQCLIQL